ncbi:MAG: hypothetical protein V1797_04310, partial [Pseudomonadota bacterium]
MAKATPPPGAEIIDLVDVVGESKRKPAKAKPPADDLDALLAELDGNAAPAPAAPAAGAAPAAEQKSPVQDDLDALLAELSGGG